MKIAHRAWCGFAAGVGLSMIVCAPSTLLIVVSVILFAGGAMFLIDEVIH